MPKNPTLSRSPDYYAARSVEERRLAMRAKDPQVRAIHLKLAENYAQLAGTQDLANPEKLNSDERA